MNKLETFHFGGKKVCLDQGNNKFGSVSKSSMILSEILPKNFENKSVIDLGCGTGFMSMGALVSGADFVLAADIDNVRSILEKNLEANSIQPEKLQFAKSNLFASVASDRKFDIVIANLPQHALPATVNAQKLIGKYGGFDGTDIVCRGLTEGANFLNKNGQYFGAVSELTNFNRTFDLASCLYDIHIKKTIEKTLRENEMDPLVSNAELIHHLNSLKEKKLINYSLIEDGSIKYNVHLVEFILRNN